MKQQYKYTKSYNIFKQGLAADNPIAIAVLGICSALAVTNRVENAIVMGVGVTFVIIASSLTVSAIRNIIPAKVRMVTYMVIISTYVIVLQRVLLNFLPEIAENLGAYVGLIITNCIVMGRSEAFAAKNPIKYSVVDGLASGLGYTYVLVAVSVIREVLAFGTILGFTVVGPDWVNWVSMAAAPGGFFILGLFIWLIRELTKNYEVTA